MSSSYNIQNDIQLPLPTAIWVLGAHLYALLVPLVLITALVHHWDFVVMRTDYPLFMFFATGLMMAGSAFEIGQNAIDRWYLTAETGSAEGAGFCDFMFFWLIVMSQGAILVACMGNNILAILISVIFIAIFPWLYFRQVAIFLPLTVLGLLSMVAAYLRFEDPVIFIQLLLSPLTMYFFGCLLKTGAQVLHGFTTASASSGVLFLAWGIHGGAEAQPQSWTFVLGAFAITAIVAIAIRPLLLRLPATRRVESASNA
ncbi:MAG: hypothetical protein GY886_11855 [Gammaproteobacteria bacterium]|nr:hypothetical protein [Gammaproteobacteria bacterium]MCP4832897.1 hypothetical protein [Gammaproteobacteria bacterium]MCP4930022.1 hypothetical protein [Gammaproteobacteria bacterium]